MPEKFSLERILTDMASGKVRGFEIRIDPAHEAKEGCAAPHRSRRSRLIRPALA